ncbi:mCG1038975, isoform CRA_a, partial [Mus musculus]
GSAGLFVEVCDAGPPSASQPLWSCGIDSKGIPEAGSTSVKQSLELARTATDICSVCVRSRASSPTPKEPQ